MRALITGAAGFAGQHLVRELLSAGYEVFGGTLGGQPPAAGTLSAFEIESVAWIPLDVCSGDSLRRAVHQARPERLFHLAAQSSVALSFADPLATWAINATGTVELLHVVADCALPVTRVLVVSSAEVYGVVPDAEQPIPETRPLRPVNPYAASKAAAEIAALQAAASGSVSAVVVRSFAHTGPGQDSRFALAGFARQLASIRDGEAAPTLQVGNLTARRDYMDVRDAVRAYRHLVEHGESGGVYNVCSGEAHEIGALLDRMVAFSGTGARIEIEPERFRPVDVPLLCGDPARVQSSGWRPRYSLDQTLRELLDAAWEPST